MSFVKRLVEKPRFELAAKGVFRLGRCSIFWYGVPVQQLGMHCAQWILYYRIILCLCRPMYVCVWAMLPDLNKWLIDWLRYSAPTASMRLLARCSTTEERRLVVRSSSSVSVDRLNALSLLSSLYTSKTPGSAQESATQRLPSECRE